MKKLLVMVIAVLFAGCAQQTNIQLQRNSQGQFEEVYFSKDKKGKKPSNRFEWNEGFLFVNPQRSSEVNVHVNITDDAGYIWYYDNVSVEKNHFRWYKIYSMNLPRGTYEANVTIGETKYKKLFVQVTESNLGALNRIKPRKPLAILPAFNKSVDVAGAEVLRNLVFVRMTEARKYPLIHKSKVDSLLRLEGVTVAGQLQHFSNEELFTLFNTDGLVFIEIEEMVYKTLGISSTKKVEANFRIVTPDTTYYRGGFKIDTGKSAFQTIFEVATMNPNSLTDLLGDVGDVALRDLGIQLGDKFFTNWLFKHDLIYEINEVTKAFVNDVF